MSGKIAMKKKVQNVFRTAFIIIINRAKKYLLMFLIENDIFLKKLYNTCNCISFIKFYKM